MHRIRSFFTPLNLHLTLVAVLLIVDIIFGIRVVLAQRAIHSDETPTFTAKEIHYGQLQAQMEHIQNLPTKVRRARRDADKFINNRIAPNDSTIAGELGNLAAKENVQLTNAQYMMTPASDGLTQVRIDASLSGQYAPLMHFINDLERDKNHVFFIISGITLNGQQGGLVNLRLRVDTYMRADAASPSPSSSDDQSSENASAMLHYPLAEVHAWR
jgi:hypothetical protein